MPKTRKRRPAAAGRPDTVPTRVKLLSKGSSQIVKDAAAVLDEEMASGIVAAKQMQQRFQKEKRIDPADFKEAIQRFKGHAHEVVNQLNSQFAQAGGSENAELMKNFVNNTHDLLDLTVELVNTGAEIADKLAQSSLPKPK